MKKCPYCAEEIADDAVKCKHCGEFLNKETPPPSTPAKKFTRSKTKKMFAGVCGGLADYANMDVSLVRLLTVLAVFFSGIFPGIIAYIVVALVVPEE